MMDPNQAQALVRQLMASGQPDMADLESRARQGRLSFAATISAMRSNCQCEACGFLRQAIDVLLADAKKEVSPVATGTDSRP